MCLLTCFLRLAPHPDVSRTSREIAPPAGDEASRAGACGGRVPVVAVRFRLVHTLCAARWELLMGRELGAVCLLVCFLTCGSLAALFCKTIV